MPNELFVQVLHAEVLADCGESGSGLDIFEAEARPQVQPAKVGNTQSSSETIGWGAGLNPVLPFGAAMIKLSPETLGGEKA